MQITRRQFINAACASAIIAAGGGVTASFGQALRDGLFPIPAEVYSEPLFSLSGRQFQRFLGNRFSATIEGQRPASLVLTEVNTLERSQNTIGGTYGDCFSLIFTGSERRPLQQGTYLMAAAGLDSFSALLVPVDHNRIQYEIIINHITS